MTRSSGANHGFDAPHARSDETNSAAQLQGEAVVAADDGTPMRVTFEAAGVHETDVTAVHRTSASRPVLTSTGIEWEAVEISGVSTQ